MKAQVLLIWLGSFALGALMLLPLEWAVVVMWCAVGIETAHSFAPIGLGWMRLRDDILTKPEKWIGLPGLAVFLAITWPFHSLVPIGGGRSLDFGIVTIAALVNAWHFGMQNFGVLRLLGVCRCRRLLMIVCLAVSALGIFGTTAFLAPRIVLIISFAISANHWVTDLALTRRAASNSWLILGVLLLAGLVGYCAYDLTPRGIHRDGEWAIRALAAVLFVHCFYSRWVWQRGRELLGPAHGDEILMVESTIRSDR